MDCGLWAALPQGFWESGWKSGWESLWESSAVAASRREVFPRASCLARHPPCERAVLSPAPSRPETPAVCGRSRRGVQGNEWPVVPDGPMANPDRSMRLIAFRRGLIPTVSARRRVMRRVRARLRFSQRGWSARRRADRVGRPFRMRRTGRRGRLPAAVGRVGPGRGTASRRRDGRRRARRGRVPMPPSAHHDFRVLTGARPRATSGQQPAAISSTTLLTGHDESFLGISQWDRDRSALTVRASMK